MLMISQGPSWEADASGDEIGDRGGDVLERLEWAWPVPGRTLAAVALWIRLSLGCG